MRRQRQMCISARPKGPSAKSLKRELIAEHERGLTATVHT